MRRSDSSQAYSNSRKGICLCGSCAIPGKSVAAVVAIVAAAQHVQVLDVDVELVVVDVDIGPATAAAITVAGVGTGAGIGAVLLLVEEDHRVVAGDGVDGDGGAGLDAAAVDGVTGVVVAGEGGGGAGIGGAVLDGAGGGGAYGVAVCVAVGFGDGVGGRSAVEGVDVDVAGRFICGQITTDTVHFISDNMCGAI